MPRGTPESKKEQAIRFIASGDTVLTSTFHGVYWATLLERRVLCIPYSSKFFHMKHPPVMTSIRTWEEDLETGRRYPGALEECRVANRCFAEAVKRIVSGHLGVDLVPG